MLHWICPECGNECEPSDRDCPSCYPPDPNTARQWKAATVAAPPPLPVTPSVVVREPVAIPAFLIPAEDPGSDTVRTLRLPVPVLAPPTPPIPHQAASVAVPAEPDPSPVPAGLAALSHNMRIREGGGGNVRPIVQAETVEPFPAPRWDPAADSLVMQYSWAEPALDPAGRVPHSQWPEAPPPPKSTLRNVNPEPVLPATASVAAEVATPGLWLQIVPDEIKLPEPEPPVEQDPAMAGPSSWRPSQPAMIAPPRQTGVAAAIQLTDAPWVPALRIPFHDASPEWDTGWIEQAQLIRQLDRIAGTDCAPLTRLQMVLEPRAASNLKAPLPPPAGYEVWPFEGPRPVVRAVRRVKLETDPMVLDAAERTAVQAVEKFVAAASQLAGMVRLPVRIQFRKGFTATGFWLDRQPEPWPPLPPQGAPVTDYRVPMDRAVLSAIEEERRKALELLAPPSPAPKANNALVLVPNPVNDRKVGPNGTIEILHPIIETPVPSMAKQMPLPLFGLRPKQSNPRPRHVPLKAEFPPEFPFIPMRSVADVRIIPSPLYGEKRPKTYKPAKTAAMPQMETGAFRQPSTSAGWMVTAGIALLIPITAIGVVNYWILPSQRASAASNPPAVESAAPVARPAATEPGAASPAGGGGSSQSAAGSAGQAAFRKSLQLTGIRMLDGGRVQFLVVNIGKTDIPPSSVFQVTLRSNNPKPGEPPVGSFQVRLNAPLSPREARDLVTPITLSSQLRPDVDLNDLRVEMQPVSSPVAIRR